MSSRNRSAASSCPGPPREGALKRKANAPDLQIQLVVGGLPRGPVSKDVRQIPLESPGDVGSLTQRRRRRSFRASEHVHPIHPGSTMILQRVRPIGTAATSSTDRPASSGIRSVASCNDANPGRARVQPPAMCTADRFQSTALIKVNADDGSGTIEHQTLMTTAALAQMRQPWPPSSAATRARSVDPFSEDQARDLAGKMGDGVTLVSSTPLKTSVGEGRANDSMVFCDITRSSLHHEGGHARGHVRAAPAASTSRIWERSLSDWSRRPETGW